MASRHSSRNGHVRVVLYLRVSTDRQENSLDSQRAELTRLIDKRPDHRIVAEYVDEAISGDDTERRTGFLQMREDAQAGRFDLVLTWDQDRFGRFDLIDGGHYIRPFRQAGVRLETIAQGVVDWEDLTGQLIYSVNQMAKAQFLRDLSRNTTRGLISSAREGKAGTGGRAPFGYRSEGERVWVAEDEAETVRLAFRLYLKPGGSLRGVVVELNKRGVKTPRGKKWRASNVRSILVRRKYTGTFVYGGTAGGKYFAMAGGELIPRRKADGVTASEPITHVDRFEAIIDQRTFDRAQAKLADSQGNTAPRTARQYLLTGLVRCGDCGGGMGGRTKRDKPLYECRTYNQSGASECQRNTIHEAPLVAVIAQKIQDRYLSESALDRLRKKIEAKLAKQDQPPAKRDLAKLQRQIDTLDQKIERGAERVLEVPEDLLPTIYRKLQDLRTDRDKLKAQLQALTTQGERSSGGDGSEVDRVIGALRSLGEALQTASPADTKRLLASIVTNIELHFTEGTGRKKRDFSHGMIYVRPDANENRGTGDSEVPQLYNKGPVKKQPSPPRDSQDITVNEMAIEFKNFPLSYRFCQGSMLTVLVLAASTTSAYVGSAPSVVKIGFACLFGLFVIASLIVSVYVVVRYPYLSLLRPIDGDHFDKQIGPNANRLVRILKILALSLSIMLAVLIPLNGIDTLPQALTFCYSLIMIPFLFFLTFLYNPISHPTIATFIRATFGVGLVFYPVYIPFLVIGAIRCQRILNATELN